MIADERRRFERAREAGRQAFRAGRKESHCPYRQGTSDREREAWMLGFIEAKAERGRA